MSRSKERDAASKRRTERNQEIRRLWKERYPDGTSVDQWEWTRAVIKDFVDTYGDPPEGFSWAEWKNYLIANREEEYQEFTLNALRVSRPTFTCEHCGKTSEASKRLPRTT